MTAHLHCLQRARERYGIDLTLPELKELTRRCHGGEGWQKNSPTMRGGARAHILVHDGRLIDIIWRAPNGDHNEFGFIITIMSSGSLARGVSYVDGNHRQNRFRRRN